MASFLARLGVERMLLQVFHVIRRQFRGIGLGGNQIPHGIAQPDAFHPFRHRHRLAVMRGQQDFFRAAQMRDALRRRQRQFGVGKFGDDFFQRGARRVGVLRQLEMPVGELGERGGDLPGRRGGRIAEMVQRDFRAGQILHVLGLNGGQQAGCLRNRSEIWQAACGFPRWLRAAGMISVWRARWNNTVSAPAVRCRRHKASRWHWQRCQ